MARIDRELVVGIIAVAIVAVAASSPILVGYMYGYGLKGDLGVWEQLIPRAAGIAPTKVVYEKEYSINSNISLHVIVSNGGLVVLDNASSSNKLKVVVAENPITKSPKAYFINTSGPIVDVRADGYTLYLYTPKNTVINIKCNAMNSGVLVNLSSAEGLGYFRMNMDNSGAEIVLHDLLNANISLTSIQSGAEILLYYKVDADNVYSPISVNLRNSGIKMYIIAPGYAFNIDFEGGMSGAKIIVDNETFSATNKWFYIDDEYYSSSRKIAVELHADMSGVKLWVEKNK